MKVSIPDRQHKLQRDQRAGEPVFTTDFQFAFQVSSGGKTDHTRPGNCRNALTIKVA